MEVKNFGPTSRRGLLGQTPPLATPAIVNSNELAKQVKPNSLQRLGKKFAISTSTFGNRRSRYVADDPLHVHLIELGKAPEQEIRYYSRRMRHFIQAGR